MKLFTLRPFLRECYVRGVATWSPLAFAFNAKASRAKYSYFGEHTGLFGHNVLHHKYGFHLLRDEAIARTEVLLHEAQHQSRARKMVQVFDELSDTLCKVADLAEFVRIGHPDFEFKYAAKEASVSISNLVEKLNTNKRLYNDLKSVTRERGDVLPTTPEDVHVAELFLFDFEQCGIHLDDATREKVVQLNDYILHVGSNFMSHSQAPRKIPKTDLPEAVRHCFETDRDKAVVSGLFADSDNAAIREAAYRAFLSPDEQQQQMLDSLLSSRHELSTLCGFPTYAHRAVRGSIAGTPEFVAQFLENLSEEIRFHADEDYSKLLQIKKKSDSPSTEILPWDVPYLTAKAKRQLFGLKINEYSPYFSLGACMDGLNFLFEELYNVSLYVEEPKIGELWHDDVKKVAVHEQGNLLGYIYCDFYEREGKPNQDCHFTIQGGKMLEDGTYQKPIVVLMLNLPSPTWSTPSLLTHGMVDNLFHEMGHAMHSMLARTNYQHVTGTRCSTDLAEVPSILMEYFSSDPRVVSKFARHYETGETIPEELVNKLWLSKRMFSASEMQLQIFYASFDQACHGKHPLECSTTELLSQVQNRHYGLPHVPNTAWQLRFSHLVGYGAKYYSYLMSRAVASWIWHRSFKNDPFNRVEGQRYRKEVLAHGGSKPPLLLVKDFLKEDITPETLTKALLRDIDFKY